MIKESPHNNLKTIVWAGQHYSLTTPSLSPSAGTVVSSVGSVVKSSASTTGSSALTGVFLCFALGILGNVKLYTI